MPKIAWIVGSGGQDGILLGRQLKDEGVHVIGIGRTGTSDVHGNPLERIDVVNKECVTNAFRSMCPDEIYYVAAVHQPAEFAVSDIGRLHADSLAVHVEGVLNILEVMRQHPGVSRLVYAASSHMFGYPSSSMQNEATPWAPICPYGITKTAGANFCQHYRNEYGLSAAVGILYNHESVLRKPQFISMKLIQATYAAKLGRLAKLEVGSLDSVVDWGYAPDYADAMIRMARHHPSDTFVVATGKPRTVRDFARIAFETVDLDADDFLVEKSSLVKKPRRTLVGDASRLRKATGWKPSLDFEEMVRRMTKEYHTLMQHSSSCPEKPR
jgi:GDPmannose 4,6-dehydratase